MAERSVDEAPGSSAPAAHRTTISVTIRYFAAARAAAGVQEEELSVPTSPAGQGFSGQGAREPGISAARSTVGELLDRAAHRHGPELAKVLLRCSFLLDEVAVHGRQTPVQDGQVLDILPPFAGG